MQCSALWLILRVLNLAAPIRCSHQLWAASHTERNTNQQYPSHPVQCRTCGTTLGAALEHPGPAPVVLQWYPFRILPGGCEKSCDLLGQVLSQYMLEQTERQAVHHFLLSDADGDNARSHLLLWLFQPLLDLQIPGRPLYHACKILFRVVPVAPPVPHATLILPHDACNEVGEALRASSLIYPRHRRVLGEWHIGWLPRSID